MFNSLMNYTISNYSKYSGKVRVVGTKDNWVVAVTIKIYITNYFLKPKINSCNHFTSKFSDSEVFYSKVAYLHLSFTQVSKYA